MNSNIEIDEVEEELRGEDVSSDHRVATPLQEAENTLSSQKRKSDDIEKNCETSITSTVALHPCCSNIHKRDVSIGTGDLIEEKKEGNLSPGTIELSKPIVVMLEIVKDDEVLKSDPISRRRKLSIIIEESAEEKKYDNPSTDSKNSNAIQLETTTTGNDQDGKNKEVMKTRSHSRWKVYKWILITTFVAVGPILATLMIVLSKTYPVPPSQFIPSPPPTRTKPISPPPEEYFRKSSIIRTIKAISGDAIYEEKTPQNQAMMWIIKEDPQELSEKSSNLIQRYVLMLFYFSLSGKDWTYKYGYGGEEHECDWYGVSCARTLEVTGLRLENNNLDGTLPIEFTALASLTRLNLYGNEVFGKIPTLIGNLRNLNELDLGKNSLDGHIPSSITNLTNLEKLCLDENNYVGSIPLNIGSMTNLVDLFLYGNALTGNIPSSIGYLVKLERLDLGKNYLDGQIPTTIVRLIRLERLYFDRNYLTGSIPSDIGSLISLAYFNISDNKIDGNIPASVGFLSNLAHIWIKGNDLDGAVPQSLCDLLITTFYADCNGLSPEIQCPCCTHCCEDTSEGQSKCEPD